jgi:fructuronate reductase
MKDALKPQDYLYTLATLGETTEYRVIGSIQSVLVAPETPQAVIDCLAEPSTHLVSSTITEKGYYLGSNGVDFEQSELQNEFASLENPKTIYGFLARGILQRAEKHKASKLTIMCCDNISGGGEYLKQGTEYLLAHHDREALTWSQKNVAFISSMVDRVCPATDDALKSKVLNGTKHQDAWPVSAEPYTQWIIEKDFAGDRPAFDKVGAVFVDDIAPFERMKLRYLNCAHTMISTLGYLSGQTYVHQALERPEIFKFTRQALYENVLPNAPVPEGYDGEAYIESVLGRFQNGNLPYGNLQVGTDSSQKIQQRWFPTIEQAILNDSDTSFFELCLGAWVIFIQQALENNVLNDPKKTDFQQTKSRDVKVLTEAYLRIANADQFIFFSHPKFIASVCKHAKDIQEYGVQFCLDQIV